MGIRHLTKSLLRNVGLLDPTGAEGGEITASATEVTLSAGGNAGVVISRADGSVTFPNSTIGGGGGGSTEVGTGVVVLSRRPSRTLTSSNTIATGDEGGTVRVNSAGNVFVTIPADVTAALPVGFEVEVLQLGAGTTTVTTESGEGTLLNGVADGGADLGQAYTGVVLTKLAADQWYMSGTHGTVA